MNFPVIPTDRPIAVDTETTGLKFWMDEIFAIAIAWYEGESIVSHYVDIRTPAALAWARDQIPRAQLALGHNFRFDVHFLREAGIRIDGQRIDCTMVREALIRADVPLSLHSVAHFYLHEAKETDIWVDLSRMFGGKPTRAEQIKNLPLAPSSVVAGYAKKDAELALRVWFAQNAEITSQGLEQICEWERRLLRVIIDMEARGVRVNTELAEEKMAQVDANIQDAQRDLDALVGFSVNVNSTPQKRKICGVYQDSTGSWFAKDGTALEKTDTGNPELRAEALNRLRFPEAKLIARIASLIKMRDVFLGGHILGHQINGLLHPSINQTRTENGDGTYTGRLSITEPALQQIPSRDSELAAIIRPCFVPDNGDHEWVSCDWKQLEQRTMVHYAQPANILAAYASNPDLDFYNYVSSITGLPRNIPPMGGGNAKQLTLSVLFGMSDGRAAKVMRLPYSIDDKGYLRAGPEAQDVLARFHEALPGAKAMKSKVESVARARGYIKTPLGRHVRLEPDECFKAAGLLYQATAGDLLKYKMVQLYELLEGQDARLSLTVHDEFDMSMAVNSIHELVPEVERTLTTFEGEVKLRVPIRVDIGRGPSWWEASK